MFTMLYTLNVKGEDLCPMKQLNKYKTETLECFNVIYNVNLEIMNGHKSMYKHT